MRRRGALALAAAVAVLAGCGGDDESAERERVDERAGSFRGVAIGDSETEVQRKLGRPRTHDPEGRIPGGESVIPYLRAGGQGGGLSYEGAFYALSRERVSAIIAYGEGATTSADVGIGDALSEAEDAFPEARCEEAEFGDPSRDPYCQLRTGPCLWLWLGGDPIDNVVLSDVPPDGTRVRCPRR